MNIGQAIRDEVAAMGMHPYDINCGYCGEFADNVIKRLGGYREGLTETGYEELTGLEFGDLPEHVWIVCDGFHYDSEEPEGVRKWQDLPIFARARQNSRQFALTFSRFCGIIQEDRGV